jgi:hypothetical protein
LSATLLKKVGASPVASAEKIFLTYSDDTMVSCDNCRGAFRGEVQVQERFYLGCGPGISVIFV